MIEAERNGKKAISAIGRHSANADKAAGTAYNGKNRPCLAFYTG